MRVTRVVYEVKRRDSAKPLAICSIILDDCLKLNGVRLYSGDKGYYLVLPSCEDIYQKVQELNPNLKITFPECVYIDKNKKKDYEELYHPVTSNLYHELLQQVVLGYELMKQTGKRVYVVEKN